MRFIKWLGVTVPEDVEKQILEAENKVGKSVDLLCAMCKKILDKTKGCGRSTGHFRGIRVHLQERDQRERTSCSATRKACSWTSWASTWLVRYKHRGHGRQASPSFDYVRPAPASPGAALPSRRRNQGG